ncbi:MAG: penicillin acylase family protein [Thermoleophilia bacterium]|nr:penicillin acylase family protein [Thermoleophilia bacterium]
MSARPAAVLVALAAAVLAAGTAALGATAPRDHAAEAWNILAPGQAGGVAFTENSTDQAALYDALTPLQDRISAATVRQLFKRETLGLGGERAVRVERPRGGVVVRRDRFGVPHVDGRRDVDVAFGAGWVTAEDRQLIMELLRGPGRAAALDVPGLDAFSLALSGKTFVPSPAAEERLAAQFRLLERQGAKGRRVVRLIDAYVAGINAYYRSAKLPIQPWTRTDVVGIAGLIGAVFGAGGGDELRRTNFLALLQDRLGAERGRRAWEDLRLRDDPEARVAVPGVYAYGRRPTSELGNVVVDADSFTPAGPASQPGSSLTPSRLGMSNALLVGKGRSATGRPLMVAGPQVGYYYPGIMLELDLHGGGFDARGAAFPGISFAVLIGRGLDYAWSATSAGSDLVDQYAETLCDGSDVKYLYKGECRAMTRFDAGVLKGGPGAPDVLVEYDETVHGPVIGYARVGGAKVAITSRRSTRDRELLAAPLFVDLSTNAIRSAGDFKRAAARFELTFNWHYVDSRSIAEFTTGRLPIRPSTVDAGLLTKGTGQYEWQGFASAGAHPQVVNPRAGVILNWNNKPARGYAASDSEWSYGSVQRVDLLWSNVQARRKHTLASLTAAMNRAATTDLRVARVWPVIREVLAAGKPPNDRAAAAVRVVDEWLAAGGSRLDGNADGDIDAPGAAVLDAAWDGLTEAVLAPVLGPLTDELARLVPRDDAAQTSNGSAYLSGWYSYVDKDLRALLGRPGPAPFGTRYCGAGALVRCAESLWAVIDAVATALGAAHGSDPSLWRASATAERIRLVPGINPTTMRWTNRPTFQQLISFATRRP